MSTVDTSRLQGARATNGVNASGPPTAPLSLFSGPFSMATFALGLKQDLHHRTSAVGIERGLLTVQNEQMRKLLANF